MSEEETEKIESENLYLESPQAFHLEMPLYAEFDLSEKATARKVYELISHDGTIDAYCVECDKESVFTNRERIYETPISIYRQGSSETPFAAWMKRGQLFDRVVYSYTRVPEHKYYTYYYKSGNSFVKIGQYPSGADFQIPQAAKYRKILGEQQYKELTRGIGLAAHGVGIGSFVYLRRIFENLIEEAHVIATGEGSFDEEEYTKARMDGKIQMLEHYLPEFLVENKTLYSILSIGIHSLTEEDCLKYFESVKIGIEQILDEKIDKIEKVTKATRAREAVQKISGEMKK
jgi:hypothetical protein